MGPAEMIVAIVAIVTIGGIIRAKYGHRHGRRGRTGNEVTYQDQDAARLREEVKALKERVAVLERLATDGNSSLEREIEKLRSRDDA